MWEGFFFFLMQFSYFISPAASSLGQQLQQDPNDPTKWQVVTTGTPQATQLVTVASAPANSSGQMTASAQAEATTMEVVMTTETPASTNNSSTPAKPRLRRVACTCPNCKDGEGKQYDNNRISNSAH